MTKLSFFHTTMLIVFASVAAFIVLNADIEKRLVAIEKVQRQFVDVEGKNIGGVQHFTRKRYKPVLIWK